jgi:hypothetical protein
LKTKDNTYNSSSIIRLEYVIVNALDERDHGQVAPKDLALTQALELKTGKRASLHKAGSFTQQNKKREPFPAPSS